MSVSENWVLAERKTADGLSLVRIRRLGNSFQFKTYGERMSVIWTLQDKSPTDTPSVQESEFMERFERRLCELLEPSAHAFLSIVFTEPGFREYVFYSREVKRFVAAINKVPEESAPFPIEIRHEPDSSGQFYQSYAQRLLG
jgi:Family of unknown function (DUF695)